MNKRVVIGNKAGSVRLSFPNLFEAKAIKDGDEAKYSTMLLIDKNDAATVKALRDAEAAARKDGFEGGRFKDNKGRLPKEDEVVSTIKDGDEDGTAEDYPEREGHLYLTAYANQNYRPEVVDRNVNPVIDRSEVYSGVTARVSLTAFPYNYMGKRGVSFGLNNVQVLGTGQNLGGGKRASEDFDEVEADDLI